MPPQPIDLNKGRKPAPSGPMQVPPPARPLPPGMRGNPPLPVGQPVSRVEAVGVPAEALTPHERAAMDAVGWKSGEPIPRNMAQILAEHARGAVADATANLPLPVDPSTPPLKVNTVHESQLPPEERLRVRRVMQEALAAEAAQREVARANASQRLPKDVEEAVRMAQAQQAAQQAAQAPAVPPARVEDDLAAHEQIKAALPPADRPPPATKQAVNPRAAAQPSRPPPAPPEPEPAADAGADKTMTHCPHCNLPLDMVAEPEPPYHEKMAFLHSVLGQKSFVKDYDLFGGAVSVTFRSLTTQETDVCFAQAYHEKEMGRLPTPMDFWERVNRLTLYLQLQALKSQEFQHDMPDGLSAATNPRAQAHWELPDPEPGGTGLPYVEDWLLANVLRTASLNRVVTNACNRFNRLVAKMEALVDNSDFWQRTEAQS